MMRGGCELPPTDRCANLRRPTGACTGAQTAALRLLSEPGELSPPPRSNIEV